MPQLDDAAYLELVLKPIRICAHYRPKFGQSSKGALRAGLTLAEFQTLYRGDPFYSWFGLDNPLMYAAHKAAGGMTSIYRQIGIGSQWVFYQMLQDHFGLNREQAIWSYKVDAAPGKQRTLTLDGRVALSDLRNDEARNRVQKWL